MQGRAAELAEALPGALLRELRGGLDAAAVPLDFFLVQDVRDRLVAADGAERGLFGRLAGAAGEWDAVAAAYRKGDIFLGELSQQMSRYTDYEIPYQRKQLKKFKQQLDDMDRKEVEHERSAAASALRYREACEALEIAGDNLEGELSALTKKLPGIFEGVAGTLRQGAVGEAIQYMAEFLEYVAIEAAEGDTLPTLKLFRDPVSDTLVRDSRQSSIEIESISADLEFLKAGGTGAEPAGISWDIGAAAEGAGEGEPAGISWDIEAEPAGAGDGAEGGGISWDVEAEPVGDAAADGERAGIAWDIEEAEPGAAGIEWDIAVDESAAESTPAAEVPGTDEWTMISQDDVESADEGTPGIRLQDGAFRNKLLDDVYELRAFLMQRKAEGDDGEILSGEGVPARVRDQTPESLQAMLDPLAESLEHLTSEETERLILLKSQKYLIRTAASLKQKAVQEGKYRQLITDLDRRRREARSNVVETTAKLEFLLKHTKRLKAHAEEHLSALYDGRKVNIMGKINAVLTAPA